MQSITTPLLPPLHSKRFLLVVNTTSNPCILHTLNTLRNLNYMILKKLHINLHEELRSHFLYITKFIETINCLSTFITYCIGITIFPIAYLVQLQLILQVHYINNVTFHNKMSHAIHTYRLKQSFISVECGVEYCTSKTSIPYISSTFL